ncbi:MAG: SHOCT domain-containing protein [Spirochaetes bacterium]|nr:SHOCT domain-containing protein [Spirochaetota bacterium]
MGIFLVALIALVVVLIVRLSRSGTQANAVSKDRGLDILSGRFARGEIDAETFRSMKSELEAKA